MKKKFLISVLILLGTCLQGWCQTPPPGDIPLTPPPPKPKGLTETPEVKACYTSDTLTVSITGYYGDVEVTVEEAVSGTVQTTQTEYVSWQATIATDILGLVAGNYVLYIRLDNDDEYVGYFSK